jgi:hypothetical protein
LRMRAMVSASASSTISRLISMSSVTVHLH